MNENVKLTFGEVINTLNPSNEDHVLSNISEVNISSNSRNINSDLPSNGNDDDDVISISNNNSVHILNDTNDSVTNKDIIISFSNSVNISSQLPFKDNEFSSNDEKDIDDANNQENVSKLRFIENVDINNQVININNSFSLNCEDLNDPINTLFCNKENNEIISTSIISAEINDTKNFVSLNDFNNVQDLENCYAQMNPENQYSKNNLYQVAKMDLAHITDEKLVINKEQDKISASELDMHINNNKHLLFSEVITDRVFQDENIQPSNYVLSTYTDSMFTAEISNALQNTGDLCNQDNQSKISNNNLEHFTDNELHVITEQSIEKDIKISSEMLILNEKNLTKKLMLKGDILAEASQNEIKNCQPETQILIKEKFNEIPEIIQEEVNFNLNCQSHSQINKTNSLKQDKVAMHCVEEEEVICIYHLKWITFNGRKLPIITQNENGPCPLLAICNLLLLRGHIVIPADTMIVESTRLLSYLTDYIFDCTPKNISADNRLNYEQNMNDAIAIFPKLQTGLDVNVRFTGVSHFEFTTECIVFDLLNIRLFHGWLVDPTDNVAEVIGTLTYNQLVEKIISQKNNEELCGNALLAEDFLYRTASQMTYHGLCELNSALNNDEMAVLFRNNHFLTLFKHKNEMYVLATDHGFLNEPHVVWESLGNIEGDSIFLDGNLKPFRSSDPVVADPNQIDRDFQLALSLQDSSAEYFDFEEMPWDEKLIEKDHHLALKIQAEEEKNLKDQIDSFVPETSTTLAQNPAPAMLRSATQLHASSSASDVHHSIPTSQSRRSVTTGPTKEKKDTNCLIM